MSLVQFDQNSNESPFDTIRHIDEQGNEFWMAKELMPLLEYKQWRSFQDTIERAKITCKNSNNVVSDHFANVDQMQQIGDSQATRCVTVDVKLTRHGCYLVAMNGDPRKEAISKAQTYFAVKTRQAEVQEQKTMCIEEIILANAQALLEQRKRLDAIEGHKLPLLERQAQLLQAQVNLLENQNHLLTEKNEILEEKVAEMEFEQKTQKMEIEGNSAELDRFKNGMGYWYAILGYAKLKGVQLSLSQASQFGRQATALCRQHNIVPETVTDPRFGKVNTYPEYILQQLEIA